MDDNPIDIATLPGFAHFTPDFQRLLASAAAGNAARRTEVLAATREAVAVFAELQLLQFVYLPTDDADDLPGDDEDDDDDVAWFSVDGVEIDDERSAVMLIGDVTHLYGGPITLEGIEDEDAGTHRAP